MNTLKTAFLLTALTLLLVLLGSHWGENGMIFAFIIAAAMNFFSYFYSDKLALRMYRAQPVTREQLPRAYAVVERMTQRLGLPMPKIYVIPTDAPNAFATGRNPKHASVAVTHGILQLLNDDELEGVLAHELGHVKNRDILTSSIAATLAGAIVLLARMTWWAEMFGGFGGGGRDRRGGGVSALFMLILAPIAAMLIQLAVSRSREYEADATGAHITGNPYALASALEKLDAYSKRMPMLGSPSTAHLFIVQPLLSRGDFANLFSTHPPIAKRIERLIGRPSVYGAPAALNTAKAVRPNRLPPLTRIRSSRCLLHARSLRRPSQPIRALAGVDEFLHFPFRQIDRRHLPAAFARHIRDLAIRPDENLLRVRCDADRARQLQRPHIDHRHFVLRWNREQQPLSIRGRRASIAEYPADPPTSSPVSLRCRSPPAVVWSDPM